jgi:hypothetical protein
MLNGRLTMDHINDFFDDRNEHELPSIDGVDRPKTNRDHVPTKGF